MFHHQRITKLLRTLEDTPLFVLLVLKQGHGYRHQNPGRRERNAGPMSLFSLKALM